jgi:Asp-tRNA(Asn)/Glu-tRNA(Gln) amidotransferase A subunit family amidase
MAREVAGCVAQMSALAPELEVPEVGLGDVRLAIAWTELAEPLVRARVEALGALFPGATRVAYPEPLGTTPAFMREIADVHSELYAEQGELYGENVRPKIELCLDVTDADAAAAAAARTGYAVQALEALDGFDLLLTPTLAFVPPPADVDEIAARTSIIRFTYPFNALGWPALALPCGAAEQGLPASAQLVGRRGDDALVLAAGLALERALAHTVSDTSRRPRLEDNP